jgi:hypothetical protein
MLPLPFVFAACGGGREPKYEAEPTVPVSGTITYQGKPLDFYRVYFTPGEGRRHGSGVTDANGKFVLGTNYIDDGGPEGLCKVSAVYVGPPMNVEPGKEGPENQVPPAKVKIPAKFYSPETSDVTQEVPAGGLTDVKIELK